MSSFKFQYHKLNIPLDLIKYSVHSGLRKPFALFLYFKMNNSGKMRLTKDTLQRAQEHLGIKDQRTITKYLNQLIQHKFIVYSTKSDIYFIHSFERLRQIYGLRKRTSVIFTRDLLPAIQSFFDAALIGQVIQNQWFFWEKGFKRFRRPATDKRDVANKVIKVNEIPRPDYYGASNYKISKTFNCSTSTACKRKHKAEVAGLLKTKEHFRLIHTIDVLTSTLEKESTILYLIL